MPRPCTGGRAGAPVLFLLLLLLPLAAVPSEAADKVSVEVGAVYASNEGTSIDPALGTIRGKLQSMFNYTSYRMHVGSKLVLDATGEAVTGNYFSTLGLGPHLGRKPQSPPAIADRNGHGPLGRVLSHNMPIQLGHDLLRGFGARPPPEQLDDVTELAVVGAATRELNSDHNVVSGTNQVEAWRYVMIGAEEFHGFIWRDAFR